MSQSKTETRPLVAVFGSARAELTGDKEASARKACEDLGQALARDGWRIAVYSSNPDFIEADVVRGYVAAGIAEASSIVYYYPQGAGCSFAEQAAHPTLFRDMVDASADWEVSFYRSLSDVDGVLILGGSASTLIAGHLALVRQLPIIALERFDGAARKLWRYVKLKPDALDESDLDVMVGWNDASASACVQSLTRQYHRSKARQQAEAATLDELKLKARCLDRIEASNNSHRLDILLTLLLFAGMLGLLAMAVETLKTSGVYLVIVLSSLAVSGALGATVRMLTPEPPRYARWTPQVIGLIGGFFVGLLYLLPHLIGDPTQGNRIKVLADTGGQIDRARHTGRSSVLTG